MKLSTTLFILLVTTITGATSATVPLAPTRPRDASQFRLLHTLTPSPPSHSRFLTAAAPAAADDSTTETTKGGAVLTLPASDTSAISSVQATFRVPSAVPPATGPTAGNPVGLYAASFWVGIDSVGPFSFSCPGSGGGSGGGGASRRALRAGVDIFYDGTLGGEQSPFAWYQFAAASGSSGSDPGSGQGGTTTGLEGFGIIPGDLVRFTLSAGSGDAAGESVVVVLAENFGANVSCAEGATPVTSVRQVLPVGEGGPALCGREAAWMVEDFPLAGLPDFPIALANFTSVTFGSAGVTLEDGSKRDVTGAEVMDVRLEAQGGRLTSCEVLDGKKVKCTRVLDDN
ncbi:concanavalin A-like lectin/glucanase [Parathielavia appendiculata]|uniref:Concanavalin A-like lectin/glucanase n=1 Tax=Parathielavia appendiculata TaxID=2587402 RepID=A0AAN6Z2B0_9PEZI|nr:concanavalin A-like lectin/glucanase [Parathielavia appendiculata]